MGLSRTLIVKLAERCNLNCSYCYMYKGPDQSWRGRPRFLSSELSEKLVERAAEYLESTPDADLILEFHGGEPLLFGRDRFADLMRHLRARLPGKRVTYCLQTNGVLLDSAWCECFAENEVHWSISADGPAPVHDRFRQSTTGRPTHYKVEAAIRLSQSRAEWARWFGGVLAVVDPEADAGSIVRYFHDLRVSSFDFLLPDATHVAPPVHLPHFSQRQLSQFLADAFDAWIALDDPHFHIRLFEHLMMGMMGREPELDSLGAGLDWLMVVETDGSYQLLDVLHTCGEQYTLTGGGLLTRSLAEQFDIQKSTPTPPCSTCRTCPVFDLCGGGYLPHRFDGKGFDKPSVHCESLYALITWVQRFLRTQLPEGAWHSIKAQSHPIPGHADSVLAA